MTPAPAYKKFRDKQTGEVVSAVSVDGGRTWRREMAPGGEAAFDVPADLGTVEGKVPKVPAKPPADAGGAQDPTDFDPSRLGEQPRRSAVLDAEEERARLAAQGDENIAKPPPPKPGLGEAVARALGNAFSGNFDDEFSAVMATRGLPSNVGLPDQMAMGLPARTPQLPKGPPGKEPNAEDIPRRSVLKSSGREENAEDIPKHYRRSDPVAREFPGDPDMAAQVGLQNEQRAADEAARKEFPKTSFATEVVGGALASAPLAAFGLPAAGASRLARMGQGAAGAIPGGVVAGAGAADEGDMTTGALMGGGLAAFGGALGGALPVRNASEAAGNYASRKRLTSTGIGRADYEELLDQGLRKPEEVGQAIEDVGLTQGITSTGYLHGADKMKAEAGKEIEAIVDDVSSAPLPTPDAPTPTGAKRPVPVDLTAIAMKLDEAATEMAGLPIPEAEKISKDLAKRAMLFATEGTADYKTAWKTRVLLDDLAFDATGQKQGVAAKRLRSIAGDLQDAIESAVAENRPDLLEPLREANKRYATASKVRNYSKGDVAGRMTRDMPMGQVALLSRTPVIGGAARAAEASGDRAKAYVARGIQQGLPAFPGALGYSGAMMLPEDLELQEQE